MKATTKLSLLIFCATIAHCFNFEVLSITGQALSNLFHPKKLLDEKIYGDLIDADLFEAKKDEYPFYNIRYQYEGKWATVEDDGKVFSFVNNNGDMSLRFLSSTKDGKYIYMLYIKMLDGEYADQSSVQWSLNITSDNFDKNSELDFQLKQNEIRQMRNLGNAVDSFICDLTGKIQLTNFKLNQPWNLRNSSISVFFSYFHKNKKIRN